MITKSSSDTQTEHLILAAEREAQMVSAFARLIITTIAMTVFLLAGGIKLLVAPVVLTYLCSYAVVSIASAVFSLKRLFNPRLSLVFTAIDGISLALLIAFALKITGTSFSLHGAVPGFVFFFSILILATMRYTLGPVVVAFFSFAITWGVVSFVAGDVHVDPATATDPLFFFGPVQNAARWGFIGIAAILCLLAVYRRRKTLETAITAANRTANLSRYLPDRVADVVAEQGINALKSGRLQEASVLFVDIRGFTGISETLEPKELSALLSEFRAIISEEVERHSGIIDKFIGDAVMAVFGVPEDLSESEANTLLCAVSILEKITTWNRLRETGGAPPVRVTIGAHCGMVFAGAVGTKSRMEYTVLGDTVNVAARLQEAAKTTGSGLVVSKDLLDRAGVSPTVAGSWSALENTAIRGRTGQVALYEYLGPGTEQRFSSD
ncbi:adenylate/guanylate cyclase domain-containing protein [Roseibium alexandrii]|uniref:Adenylate cyclase, family 3 (Some protein containing HAMP domain) n=1 Tax=Roseibium alexandrii (strain DSM 17067 / NCIMB 14079 / DFL-11) TaxID=244592 RepID=A0A5E8H7M9_ROSAD|nr:adenylate/guanylate cyclase domain-containing protein [Roseibium alexandrii]EEE48087.1 Adenylate cyclase, family 3 (some protein containing HAMP domain) [Roseibium alexandrii DFL-11]